MPAIDTAATVDLYPAPSARGSEKVAIDPGVTVEVFGGAGPLSADDARHVTGDWLNIRV